MLHSKEEYNAMNMNKAYNNSAIAKICIGFLYMDKIICGKI